MISHGRLNDVCWNNQFRTNEWSRTYSEHTKKNKPLLEDLSTSDREINALGLLAIPGPKSTCSNNVCESKSTDNTFEGQLKRSDYNPHQNRQIESISFWQSTTLWNMSWWCLTHNNINPLRGIEVHLDKSPQTNKNTLWTTSPMNAVDILWKGLALHTRWPLK